MVAMHEFSQPDSPDARRAYEHLIRAPLNDAVSKEMDVRRPDGAAEAHPDAPAAVSPADALGPPPDGRTPDPGASWPRPADPGRPTSQPQGDTPPPVAGGPLDRGGPPPPDKPSGGGEAGDNPHNSLRLFYERSTQPPPTADEAAAAGQAHQTALNVWQGGFESFERPGFRLVGRFLAGEPIAREIASEHLASTMAVAENLERVAAGCETLDAYIQAVGNRAVTSAEPPIASPASESIGVGQLDVRNTAGTVDWSDHVLADYEFPDTTREGTFTPYILSSDTVQFVNNSGTQLYEVQAVDNDTLITRISRAHTLPADAHDFLDRFRSELTAHAALLRSPQDTTANPADLHAKVTASVTRIAALLQGETREAGYVPDNLDLETLTAHLVRFTGTMEVNYRAMTEGPQEPPQPEDHRRFARLAEQGPLTADELEAINGTSPLLLAYYDLKDFLGQPRVTDDLLPQSPALLGIINAAVAAVQKLTTFARDMADRSIFISRTRHYLPGTSQYIGQYTFRVTSRGLVIDSTRDERRGWYTRYDAPDGEIHFVDDTGMYRTRLRPTDEGAAVSDEEVYVLNHGTTDLLRGINRSLGTIELLILEISMGGNDTPENRARLTLAVNELADRATTPESSEIISDLQQYIANAASNSGGE